MLSITRNIDSVGRIVIPMEYRSVLKISANDPLDISVDGDSIVIRKVSQGCVFCGEASRRLINLNGKAVCEMCLGQLNRSDKDTN